MKKKNIYTIQYDKLGAFLNKLSTDDIDNLKSRKFEIKFELKGKKELSQNSKKAILSFDEFTLNSIIDKLNQLKTREEGLTFLISKCSSKNDFETIAKKMDIPFQKKDTIDKLKDKIIESSIGYKIRSQAIQGNNLNE